jgi:hypothetical protein
METGPMVDNKTASEASASGQQSASPPSETKENKLQLLWGVLGAVVLCISIWFMNVAGNSPSPHTAANATNYTPQWVTRKTEDGKTIIAAKAPPAPPVVRKTASGDTVVVSTPSAAAGDESLRKKTYSSAEEWSAALGETSSSPYTPDGVFDANLLRKAKYDRYAGWYVAFNDLKASGDPLAKSVAEIFKQAMIEFSDISTAANGFKTKQVEYPRGEFFNLLVPERVYLTRGVGTVVLNVKLHYPLGLYRDNSLNNTAGSYGVGDLLSDYSEPIYDAAYTQVIETRYAEGVARTVFTKPELKNITHLRIISESDDVDDYGKPFKYLHSIYTLARAETSKIYDWKKARLSALMRTEYSREWAIVKRDGE